MKVVTLLSGGLDSTTLLYWLKYGKSAGLNDIWDISAVRAIGFNYGQRHVKELEIAGAFCSSTMTEFSVADLSNLGKLLPGSSQTDDSIKVPHGKYDEDSMKATVVPNRNMIMLSIAIGHAIAHGYDAVAYAAHAGDHTIYPDCRPEFAKLMDMVAKLCDWKEIEVLRPFINYTKADIANLTKSFVMNPFHTWSCYEGLDRHCGRCGTCIERREAFYVAGIEDKTQYSPSAPPLEDLVKNQWRPY